MKMRMLVLAGIFVVGTGTLVARVPEASTQAIVGLADHWNSSQVTLQRMEKTAQGWQPVGKPFAGRLGRDGLVWGLGLHRVPRGGVTKTEGDRRAPAGVFAIGAGYATVKFKAANGLNVVRVQPGDLWVEDSASPAYNQFVRLGRPVQSEWEQQQQMKQNDEAHKLKVFIHHNSPNKPGKAIPGKGSSIFFHIWRRDGQLPSAGCTTMPEENLREVMNWLDPSRFPVYVLLPRDEYVKLKASWKLP